MSIMLIYFNKTPTTKNRSRFYSTPTAKQTVAVCLVKTSYHTIIYFVNTFLKEYYKIVNLNISYYLK
jgi:hypothetical protein